MSRVNPDMSRKEQLIHHALDLLLVYTPVREIHKIFEIDYGLNYKSTYHYIGLARRRLQEVDKQVVEKKRAEADKRLDRLYYDSYKAKKFAVCLSILQEKNKLYCLYDTLETDSQPIKVEIVGDDNGSN